MKATYSLILAFIAILFASQSARADLRWTIHELERLEGQPPVSLRDVARGEDFFVAVGENGEIYHVLDAGEWRFVERLPDTRLSAIAFGHGRFVAVGSAPLENKALIVTSEDGYHWTRLLLGTNQGLLDIAFGNGRFVAVGWLDIVATSGNGLEWALDYQFVQEPRKGFRAITFGDGRFIAVLMQGPGFPEAPVFVFLDSDDGEVWSQTDRYLGSPYGLAFGRSRFLAVGSSDCDPCESSYVSADGQTWSGIRTGSGENPHAVAYGNGMFVLATLKSFGDAVGGLVTTKDLRHWHETTLSSPRWARNVGFGADRFVAVGGSLIAVSEEVVFEPLISNVRFQAGDVIFDTDAPEGTRWDIQVSSDLLDWTSVRALDGTPEGIQSVTLPSEAAKTFLRLREL